MRLLGQYLLILITQHPVHPQSQYMWLLPHFRTRQPPQRFGEWVYDEHQSIRDAIRISEACMASTSRKQEPTSYQEAMSLPEAGLWLKAM